MCLMSDLPKPLASTSLLRLPGGPGVMKVSTELQHDSQLRRSHSIPGSTDPHNPEALEDAICSLQNLGLRPSGN